MENNTLETILGNIKSTLRHKSKITFVLRDVAKNPIKSMKYEIRASNNSVVKSGSTDGQGQIKLALDAGARLFLYLQPLEQGEMKKYREFTMQDEDGTVVWNTSLLQAETTLKPEQEAGKYLRGTYEVKKVDTLTSIAKKYGTTIDVLMSLNKQLKNPNKISQGEILNVPPNKQTNDRDAERKTPPKPNTDTSSDASAARRAPAEGGEGRAASGVSQPNQSASTTFGEKAKRLKKPICLWLYLLGKVSRRLRVTYQIGGTQAGQA